MKTGPATLTITIKDGEKIMHLSTLLSPAQICKALFVFLEDQGIDFHEVVEIHPQEIFDLAKKQVNGR